MSLQHKTQGYIRRAIRQAEFMQAKPGVWHATLPAFGLETTGGDRNEAEQNLLMLLTAYVLFAPLSGAPLPMIDDVEPSGREPRVGATGAKIYETGTSQDPEQAWFWTAEWQAGEREASEDIAAGRVEGFDSAEDFFASFPD
jgi:hypothetical protein